MMGECLEKLTKAPANSRGPKGKEKYAEYLMTVSTTSIVSGLTVFFTPLLLALNQRVFAKNLSPITVDFASGFFWLAAVVVMFLYGLHSRKCALDLFDDVDVIEASK